jgi:hypothetical protein
MVASLLAGYGDPDPRALPNWTTLRIPWLLKIVDHDSRAGSRRYRTRANRALAEIESLV